jgi:hypothetical protein
MSKEKDADKPGKQISLSLLKRLVSELETTLDLTDSIREARGDVQQYIIESHKAAGLAAGIMKEGSMLVADIHMLIRHNTETGATTEKPESIHDILGGLLGKGSSDPHGQN